MKEVIWWWVEFDRGHCGGVGVLGGIVVESAPIFSRWRGQSFRALKNNWQFLRAEPLKPEHAGIASEQRGDGPMSDYAQRARLVKAQKIAAVLRDLGATAESAEKMDEAGRLLASQAAQTKPPSEDTWAIVVSLLRASTTRQEPHHD